MHFQKEISDNLPVLGIIAGGGYVPFELMKTYLNIGGKCYVAALQGEDDYQLFDSYNIDFFKIGDLKAVINYFKCNLVTNLIFAGKISRPDLKSIKVDFLGSILLAQIMKSKFFGDDQILRIVANFFEKQGFNVISAKDILAHNKILTTDSKPSIEDIKDIELGVKVIDHLSSLDIGQAVIINQGYVVGVEAAEGTDNLIKRCSNLRKSKSGGVLIKKMKLNQDQRMDIPTIGPETINILSENKYNGIAIDYSGVIVVQADIVEKIANKEKIFIQNC